MKLPDKESSEKKRGGVTSRIQKKKDMQEES